MPLLSSIVGKTKLGLKLQISHTSHAKHASLEGRAACQSSGFKVHRQGVICRSQLQGFMQHADETRYMMVRSQEEHYAALIALPSSPACTPINSMTSLCFFPTFSQHYKLYRPTELVIIAARKLAETNRESCFSLHSVFTFK